MHETYRECPGCLGDGEHDFRDEDAMLFERYSDEQLAEMRRRGMVHPLGVVTCERCGGTGEVPLDEWLDAKAASTAFMDQALARYAEKHGKPY